MTYSIRLFSEHDYDAVADLCSTIFEERISAAEMRRDEERRPAYCKNQSWVAEVNGKVVGLTRYTQNRGMYHPRKFQVDLMVLPEYRRQGIGSALYEQVTAALQEFDPITMLTGTREDWTEGVRFAEQRGYQERMRNWESHLDLTTADLSAFAPVVEQVAASGYVIRSYAELTAAAEPDLERRLHAFGQAVRQDIPSPEPLTYVAFDEWIKTSLYNDPHFAPDCYMVALKDGAIVGMSTMWSTEEAGVATTGVTGVDREHRGTGVAKALKVRVIEAARAAGYTLTKTWNASTNVKMLAINDAMGFVRKPAWISYALELKNEA
jgi:mycothiol synthase